MRCPKCHYLGFEPEPRCKNCGYDLEVADTDLALRNADTAESRADDAEVMDLPLRERSAVAAPVTLGLVAPLEAPIFHAASRLMLVDQAEPDLLDERAGTVAAPPALEFLGHEEEAVDPPVVIPAATVTSVASEEPAASRMPFRAPHTTTDLPLFVKSMPDRTDFPDEATLGLARSAAAAAPRPPLGVRRAAAPTPAPKDLARWRARPAERPLGPLDRDLLEDLKRVEREESAQARAAAAGDEADEIADRVPASHRLAAAAVDAGILGGIAAFVFWATLKLCGVSLTGLGLQSLVPLLVFLGAMDVGYLLMFTAAGGQTVGKMLMHIRVVGDESDDAHVSVRQAAWRAVLTVVSVVGLGTGWLPALFGSGLAVHDRLAHTRVVRA